MRDAPPNDSRSRFPSRVALPYGSGLQFLYPLSPFPGSHFRNVMILRFPSRFFSPICRLLVVFSILLSPTIVSGQLKPASSKPASSKPASSKPASSKPASSNPALGSIEGTVVYRADKARPWRFSRYYVKSAKSGLLAEAVVGIHDRKLSLPNPKAETVTMDQVNFQFTPETLAIRVGDSVRFTNSDKEVHSVRTSDALNRFNITVPKGKEYVQRFPRGASFRPVVLGCAFHGAMRAWIYIFDHPYYALTQSDGKFELPAIPAGKYTLRMAHPAGKLKWEKEVTIVAGAATKLTIEVSPNDLVSDAKRPTRKPATPNP